MIIRKKKDNARKKGDIEDDIEDFNFDNKRKKGGTRKKEKSAFNEHGININGLDKDGYNINGVDEDSLDKDGFNINGIKGTRKNTQIEKLI